MRVTPTFRAGSPGFVVLFIDGRKGAKDTERKKERKRTPGCVDVLCPLLTRTRICFSTRTESEPELWEDGFYFEVFPPIVHYRRELLPREAEVSEKGIRGKRVPGRREICRDGELSKNLSIIAYLLNTKKKKNHQGR